MIDISTIPEKRLAMLDNAVLFHGSHSVPGEPDCKHCALELLHEVVTGYHRDATPPGASACISILPGLNDGPWRDDDQRTRVMRPYLRKMLGLDPAKDEQRLYAILNYAYRHIMPEICDALKLDKHGAALRDLPAIIDCGGASKSTDIFVAAVKDAHARAIARGLDLDLDLERDLDITLTLTLTRARAIALAGGLTRARAIAIALTLARLLARARAIARARALARGCDFDLVHARSLARAESWERSVTALLDIICGM